MPNGQRSCTHPGLEPVLLHSRLQVQGWWRGAQLQGTSIRRRPQGAISSPQGRGVTRGPAWTCAAWLSQGQPSAPTTLRGRGGCTSPVSHSFNLVRLPGRGQVLCSAMRCSRLWAPQVHRGQMPCWSGRAVLPQEWRLRKAGWRRDPAQMCSQPYGRTGLALAA